MVEILLCLHYCNNDVTYRSNHESSVYSDYVIGLYDSLAGIIIPSINTATGIFMFRTFFVSIPDDLIESARIDGASDGKIFMKIMLPIAKTNHYDAEHLFIPMALE